MSDMAYRTSPAPDKRGGSRAQTGDKAPLALHHAPVIRAAPDPLADPTADLGESVAAPVRKPARAKPRTAKAPERQAFSPPAPIPAWARASERAGQGDPLFAAGAGLALLDAHLRRDPPCAGALRSRLALMSTAASAKILRLNADAAALDARKDRSRCDVDRLGTGYSGNRSSAPCFPWSFGPRGQRARNGSAPLWRTSPSSVA
jgi:hypothetical protein